MVALRNHNAPRWLEVRWRPKMGGRLPGGSYLRYQPAGWYVIRTCPCHKNVPVTLPLDSEERATTSMRAMLEASRKLGT